MKLKKDFDFSQANVYVLLHLDADYPDKIISFADRYMHWRNMDSIIKCFRRIVRKGKKQRLNILDVGCGNGYIDFKLKESVSKDYHLRVTGIDAYKPAIDFANTRKKFLNRDDCHFELMDACDLKLEDDSFDVVMCSQVIEHLKDPLLAIKEMYRVLKKGGAAVISTPNKREGIFSKFTRAVFKKLFSYEEELVGQKEDNPVFSQEAVHHVSVKNHKDWSRIFKQNNFILETKIGTGGLFYNHKFWEKHRVLFGLNVILDAILGKIPFSYLWLEVVIFVLRK